MSDFSEGKHKRDAGGKFTAGGGGGENTVRATPAKSFSQYLKDSGGNTYGAARAFYKAELQGKHVAASMGELGEKQIHFTASGFKKMQQNMKNEGVKAQLVPHLVSIIKDGTYLGETLPHKERNDFVSFHHFQQKVSVEGRKVNVIVDVGRRPDGQYEFSAYNLAHSESPRFAVKKQGLREAGLKVEDQKKGAAPDKGELSQSLGANALSCAENIALRGPVVKEDTTLALDVASQRRKDENGFLHVSLNPISKECVNPYYGHEVAGWEDLGLDPDRVYYALRSGEELQKAASTFSGLPLLLGHHVESAENPQKEHRVGSLGTDAVFEAPYLLASLIITDAEAIEAIESGQAREISAGYAFEPDMTAGVWNGQSYDFIMKNIRGNHVALVGEGRAGPDVAVADSINTKGLVMKGLNKAVRWARRVMAGAADEAPAQQPEQAEVEAAREILAAHEENMGADADPRIDKILAMFPDLEPDKAAALSAALHDLMTGPAATGDADPEAPADKAEDEDPNADKAEDEDPKAEDAEAEEEDKACDSEAEKATAADRAMRRKPGRAWDSDTLRAMAGDAAMARMRALSAAAREVRPLVGEILDPLAFDSATDIYGKALELAGIRTGRYPRTAWRGMCDVLLRQRSGSTAAAIKGMATDSKALQGPCKHLGNIRLEG